MSEASNKALKDGVCYSHEAVAEILVTKPWMTQRQIAQELHYTEAWLSTLINSDAFQAYYRKLCNERGLIAIHSVQERLNGIAGLTLTKIEERLEVGNPSEEFLGRTLDVTLKALGYINGSNGVGSPQPNQHLHVHVDAETLAEARERAASRFSGQVAIAGSPEPAHELREG